MIRVTPSWAVPYHIHAFTTTLRMGDFSLLEERPFLVQQMFNTYPEQNEQSKSQSLGESIQWLTQVHGDRIIDLAESNIHNFSADGVMTTQTDKPCVILTADCLPVLICTESGDSIMALHCGWRGLLSGILIQGLELMLASKERLKVWFGPAISGAVYEVDDLLRDRFIAADDQYKAAFVPCISALSVGHWLFDLKYVARMQCIAVGVNDITDDDWCTYRQKQLFYSFRRQGQAGRMATVIWKSSSAR